MSVPYDIFVGAFLEKITEYELGFLATDDRDEIVHGYMKRSIAGFKKNCKYNLVSSRVDELGEFNVDIPSDDLDEPSLRRQARPRRARRSLPRAGL